MGLEGEKELLNKKKSRTWHSWGRTGDMSSQGEGAPRREEPQGEKPRRRAGQAFGFITQGIFDKVVSLVQGKPT